LADAAALPLDNASVDLAIAFMSLHDIGAMPAAVREVARVLEPGGRFCLAIVHPIHSRAPIEKLALVQAWAEAGNLFDERERAVLAWAETVTRVAETVGSTSRWLSFLQQVARAHIEAVGAIVDLRNAQIDQFDKCRGEAALRDVSVFAIFAHVTSDCLPTL
jgi:ubiquinone/menaquinone biosynthesis C-methylase UbiE